MVSNFASRGDWDINLIDDITSSFLTQVQSLMDTVKQMDSALQRRSKYRGGGGNSAMSTSNMSDSEKISMQVVLDVREFAIEIQKFGVDAAKISSYGILLREVTEAAKTIDAGSLQ